MGTKVQVAKGPPDEPAGDPSQIALAFKHLSISTLNPPKHILTGVSGYVVKGGITAVLGPSSAGKSLLMKLLTGRLPAMRWTGEVTLDGRAINPHKQGNGFGFVPQADALIGDITVRETFEIAARLRKDQSYDSSAKDAEEVIQGLGLGKVADNVVGTVLKRGLSGGEKRRTSVGQELVVRPSMVFLDEPSSGLDGTAAYDVIKTIKSFTKRSGGDFSVMLSIHQPNLRILDLFDHILLLGRGGSIFFGTLPDAVKHFTAIGYPPPPKQVPTDYFMQITDEAFSYLMAPKGKAVDFNMEFSTSRFCQQAIEAIDEHNEEREHQIMFEDPGAGEATSTSLWRQYITLTRREAILAVRDPTLYYLQTGLHIMYGFLVGVTFYNLPAVLDDRANDLPGAVLWILMLNAYVHIFKVFYLMNANARFYNERANGSYSILAYWSSELTVTAIAHLLWFPGITIAYFMVGLPSSEYGFCLLVTYLTSLTSESMINLVTKFCHETSYAIVASQAVIVVLTVFGGGIFIPFDQIPDYWVWLQELAVFTQSSKAMMLAVFSEITYTCPDGVASGGVCQTITNDFPCDVSFDATTGACEVDGLTFVDINAGGLSGSHWEFLGYLFILLVSFRLLLLFFYRWPVDHLKEKFKAWMASDLHLVTLQHEMDIRRLKGQMASLSGKLEEEAAVAGSTDDIVVKEVDCAEEKVPEADMERRPSLDDTRRQSSFHYRGESRLVFKDVVLTLPKNGKVLIDHVNGYATSGSTLALMGPSGAGKTTLLNALSGRAVYAKVEGEVTLGDQPLEPDHLTYVPQFDELNGYFTSRELLTYMSTLKCSMDDVSRRRRVSELMHILGLIQKADVRVDQLTGGEQKRLSIGMGMVSEPSVLFLDEPTTGLDATAAYSVVEYITKMVQQTNVVCIMTIHQPSGDVFEKLESLMLLETGRLAYFGTREAASDFFYSLTGPLPHGTNPSDVYMDLISQPPHKAGISASSSSVEQGSAPADGGKGEGEGAGEGLSWKEVYLNSSFRVDMPSDGGAAPMSGVARPAASERFGTLVRTISEYYVRTPAVHWLRLLELVIVALYVGTIFFRLEDDEITYVSGAAFFNMWCALFTVIAATQAFSTDRRVALTEMLNGAYTPGAHCVAQFVASLPFVFLCSVAYQGIFHWLVGFNDTFEAFAYAVIITMELLLMMEGIMLMVVEALKNAMLATTFSMVVLGTLFLFAGFFIKPDDMIDAISWITWGIPTRYALEGYLYMIFHGQDYETASGVPLTGDQILQGSFKQDSDVKPWADVGVMAAFILLFRLGHYALLQSDIAPYTKHSLSTSGAGAFGAKPAADEFKGAAVVPVAQAAEAESPMAQPTEG